MNEERPPEHAFVVWGGKLLVSSALEPQPIDIRDRVFAAGTPVVSVYTSGGTPVAHVVAAKVESDALAAVAAIAPAAIFCDVMIELGRYAAPVRHAVVRAIAIERWSNRYQFCPACGYSLEWTSDSIAKICTNPQRVHRHFPRLDPAIIVLVTNGERVLLGRAARWPPGWYSTLAGFVEPGETLEASVQREVFEEAGVSVSAARYFGSESWPFPRSLMLGFFAEAQSTQISLHDAELEDARWFDLHELRELQARMKLARPFFDTIARRLIDSWLTQHATVTARGEPAN